MKTLLIVTGVGAVCILSGIVGFGAGWNSIEVDAAERDEPREQSDLSRTTSLPRSSDPAQFATRMRKAIEDGSQRGWIEIEDELADMREKDLWALLGEVEETEPSDARRQMLDAVLARLGELDPPRAFAEAWRLMEDRYLTSVWNDILGSWAKYDPEAALARARQMGGEDQGLQIAGISSVFGTWAEQDFEAALRAAKALQGNAERMGAMQTLAWKVVGDESLQELLYEFAQSLEGSGTRDEFLVRAVHSMGRAKSLEEVQEWIGAHKFEDKFRVQLIRSAARGAAYENPRRSAEWLMANSTEKSRAGDLEAAVAGWALSSPEACGKWLLEQMAGPDADGALSVYSTAIARRDPPAALQWASRIQNDELRRQRLIATAQGIDADQPGYRERILAESGLPAEVVRDVLETLANAPTQPFP